ncbi:MAG: HEPN domain-containing protein [Chloroflexi bacterium]|nr:HEPN domain-containing protein [Chloroflexota bacterium]
MAKKQTPLEAYEANVADARTLVAYARAFANQRTRAMRKEWRERVGDAFRIPGYQRDDLDGIESGDLIVVLKPGTPLARSDFDDRQPLLRQALVAACAAFETYLGDKAMERLAEALWGEEPPTRLQEIPLTVGQWIEIEGKYERKRWGVRAVVEEHIRVNSSTASNKVGEVLSTVGVKNWAAQVDTHRRKKRGETVSDLDALTERRNRIAHAADRRGRGRASLTADEVDRQLAVIDEVVAALESIVQ